jgi:hypothetical protein
MGVDQMTGDAGHIFWTNGDSASFADDDRRLGQYSENFL